MVCQPLSITAEPMPATGERKLLLLIMANVPLCFYGLDY